MNKLINDAKEIILKILDTKEFKIIDIFEYGGNKIEFVIEYEDKMISISVVNDLSYDFMVLETECGEIIYSNTVFMDSINELPEIIKNDLNNCEGNQ